MASIINATTSTGLVSSADNSGSLQLATNNGTTAVTVTTAQLVGVGTTSPSAKLHVSQVGNPIAQFTRSDSGTGLVIASDSDGPYFRPETSSAIRFNNSANSAEYMRIDSSGNLLVGTTTSYGLVTSAKSSGYCFATNSISNNAEHFLFTNSGTTTGSITRVGGTNVAYNTSSDYRLKENIAPMTGALAKVQQLKPCNWTWKLDGSDGQGFIAHELKEVCPDAVHGEKDAVDEEGNPKYQGVDTSFLIATLTAAIQELKAELDATKAEVQALKGVA